jgi:hypothetical protein
MRALARPARYDQSMWRLGGMLWNVATLISLLLCVATVAVWTTTHGHARDVRFNLGGSEVGLFSNGASFGLSVTRWPLGTFRGVAYDLRLPFLSVYRNNFDGGESWGVSVQAAALLTVFAIAPGLWLRKTIRRRIALRSSRREGHCPACGYDLRATPDRCPECGRRVAVSTMG